MKTKPTEKPVDLKRGVKFGSDLPAQLEIRNKRLVLIGSGESPTFDLPDGTIVTLTGRDKLAAMIDELQALRALILAC